MSDEREPDSENEGEAPAEEEWVYAGQRLGAVSKKPCDVFIDPNDVDLYFEPDKGAGYVVAGRYLAKVTRHAPQGDDERGGLTRHGQPRYLGPLTDETRRAKIQAQDHAARTMLRYRALAASDKRRSSVDEALEPLVMLAKSIPFGERDAFTVYVLKRLNRAW